MNRGVYLEGISANVLQTARLYRLASASLVVYIHLELVKSSKLGLET